MIRRFQKGDWVEFGEMLKTQSATEKEAAEVPNDLMKGQLYNPNIQYGGYTDDSSYNEPYQFIVITYNRPYKIEDIKIYDKFYKKDGLDAYSFYFTNEYGVRICISMTEGKYKFVKLSWKMRDDRINNILEDVT